MARLYCPKESIQGERIFIDEFTVAGDRHLKITVDIVEAVMSFRAHTFREEEYVSVQLEVLLEDPDSNIELGAASGSSWARRKSSDASHTQIHFMLSQALENSFRNALNKISL